MTYIVVHGSIFNKIRPSKKFLWGFGKLFNCTLCFGFWTGLFLFTISPFTELFNFDYTIVNGFICSCISAGASYLLSKLVGDRGLNLNREGGE